MSGMALSKWIRLKSPREKVYRVAARMLRSRLEAIAHYLPLAARKSAENIEYVHQLRVWTRRADAALDLCETLISKGDRRELEKQLDMLRDTAGNARDVDVLRERIAALKPGLGREHLLKDVEQRRRAAQVPLLQASEESGGGKQLLRLLKKVLKRIEKRRRKRPFRQRFQNWSREQLRPLVKKFLKRGRADLSDLSKLHKFRIAGKRLRYALELTWGALDKSRRKKAYQQLDRLQTQLGTINDARNLVAEIERALSTTKKRALQTQLRRLLTAERRNLATAQQVWAEGWSDKKADRLERRLQQLCR
jgi:CHAD domain-containing protein